MSTCEKPAENWSGVEYFDSLYRYALYLTRDRFDADDVVQETYWLAVRAVGRLRENSNIKAWLFAIMRNVWLLELRRRGRRARTEENLENISGGEEHTPHKVIESGENVARVRAAISRLEPRYREVIILREYEELSYQEIADVIGCPIGTVMSRLGRSRAKLRLLLSHA